MRIAKRSDGIESLLIGYNEQYVGPVYWHFRFNRKVPHSSLDWLWLPDGEPSPALRRPPLPDRERIEVRVRACFYSEPCAYL